MDGSLDHYWVFYQVARCRSITRASEVLFSSQPNVTHTIRVLMTFCLKLLIGNSGGHWARFDGW